MDETTVGTIVLGAVTLGFTVLVSRWCVVQMCRSQRQVAVLQQKLGSASMAGAATLFETGQLDEAAALDEVARHCEEAATALETMADRWELRLSPWRRIGSRSA
ncbi:hypothetical protein L3Q67_45275 (plasmid) [Saccharothrix sp. AJ9571]|nr:hypothetical protein L3Q67_45275 [Saccharothrix sp. AJ9571]